MSILNQLTVSTVFIATFLMGQTVWATTYYVSTTGSDGAAGNNITTPWRTLGHAAATMICGDTTLVRGGTYTTETTIRFQRTNCTVNTPITLTNYPGESPIIHWGDKTNTANKFYVSPGSPWTTPVTDVHINGLEIWGGYECVKLEASLRFVFTHNNCHGSDNQGITGTQTGGNKDATIDSNIIASNGDINNAACGGNPACNQTHGLYITGTGWTITNNLIYDNLAYGIQTDAVLPIPTPNSTTYGGFQGLIAHNTIAYQKNRAGMVLWHNSLNGGGLTLHDTTIENNIFYENSQNYASSQQGYDFAGGCCGTNVIVRNNLYYGTGNSTGFSAGTSTGMTVSNTINAEPLFKNAPASKPASPNFSLQSGSPAIDSGSSLSLVTVDFAGVTRPQGSGRDIGAYEGDSSNVPPAAPQGLVAN